MLRQIRFENWKSFSEATLYLDPLTVLIGTNASGKSNTLDGLQLLSRLAYGANLTSVLAGDATIKGIRGGLEWACLKPEDTFTIEVVSSLDGNDKIEFRYRIEVIIGNNQALINSESLKRFTYRPKTRLNPYEINLFWSEAVDIEVPYISARLYNGKNGKPRPSARTTTILSQLSAQKNREEIEVGVRQVTDDLKKLFILDPIPSHMRDYSPLSDQLEPDASNIAGVLAALSKEERGNIERTLTKYIRHLPEKDIIRVYAETVGKFDRDAMLYCDEQWGSGGGIHTMDARGMSDGSLRFLGILTALLTRPQKSTLIVEEVDNGLHPSRSELLVTMLKEVGFARDIDVLVTTHNPALLDTLGPEMVPFIVVAHRDSGSGQSRLTLLEDIETLPKLLASGPVGKLTTQGRIEKSLRSCPIETK